jgi:cold shock CspA family protein
MAPKIAVPMTVLASARMSKATSAVLFPESDSNKGKQIATAATVKTTKTVAPPVALVASPHCSIRQGRVKTVLKGKGQGYGFIVLDDEELFFHVSIPGGDSVQVNDIVEVDVPNTEDKSGRKRAEQVHFLRRGGPLVASPNCSIRQGRVKTVLKEKGYGFIVLDDHDEELYFHVSIHGGDSVQGNDIVEVDVPNTKDKSGRKRAEQVRLLRRGSIFRHKDDRPRRGVTTSVALIPVTEVAPKTSAAAALTTAPVAAPTTAAVPAQTVTTAPAAVVSRSVPPAVVWKEFTSSKKEKLEAEQKQVEAGGDADLADDASTVASLSLACKDVTATVGSLSHDCPVEGLEAVFAAAKLSDNCQKKILAWCREQEAAELGELQESFEELATTCEIGNLPKKRFQKVLNAACAGTPW